MKYNILWCLLFGLHLGAYAQSEYSEVTNLQRHQELASRLLTKEQIQAYNKRAKQKSSDMMEYVRIILKSDLVSEQKEALKQLHSLFWNVPDWARSILSIKRNIGNHKDLELRSLELITPLTLTDNNYYKGSLTYQWLGKKEVMDFVVKKNIKKIGSKEVQIWELFFNP
jgi:hypothetical protein